MVAVLKYFVLNLSIHLFSGNNRLGGQDFNQRLQNYLEEMIAKRMGKPLTDKEDLQALRLHVEDLKLNLTQKKEAEISLQLHSLHSTFSTIIKRTEFEEINADLFAKILVPIETVLHTIDMGIEDIDEIVLVGGSTRIPKVREIIADYFKKRPNTAVDPELAVAIGVSIQAGIIGGMWPLTVSAVELPTQVKKIHVH